MNKELKHNSKQNTAAERAAQLSKLFALISIAVGALVLLGWTFDIQLLKSVLPGFVSMKANSAIGFVLLGCSLILDENKKNTRLYTKILTGFVLLLGLLTFSQYIFNINLGLDQLFFLDNQGAVLTSNPGRMAPTTAVMFILLSSAFILFQSRFGEQTAQFVTLFVVATGFVSFIGYAYGVTSIFYFYGYTAILFVLLSLGVLFSKPQIGFMTILLNRNVGGKIARRILPVVILLPFLISWLHVNSQYIGLLPIGSSEIILDVINVTLFSILILWFANSLNLVDLDRKQGEDELIKQNAALNAVMNNSHSIIIFLIDTEYKYIEFNQNHRLEMMKVYGVDIKIGMSILESISIPEIREKAKRSIDRALNGETFVETEIQPIFNIYYEFHWNVVKREEKVIGASCFNIDITERETSLEKIRESEIKYRQLFDDDLSGNFITSVDGIILLANPAMAGIFGFNTADEMCGLNIVSFYKSPKSREPFLNLLREKKKLENFDREFVNRKGETIYARENVVGEFNEKGELERVKGYLFDNTKHKLAEEALQKSEESYRRFFDEDLSGDFKSTPDGKLLMCNNAFVKIVGCDSIEQVMQMNVSEFYVGQTDRNVFLNKLKEKGKLELYEATLRGCDGRIIHVIENVLGKYNEKGELVEISGYLFDITDRKKAELDLIESGKKYRQLIENASEIILLTDRNGNFTFANDAALKFSGYTFEEMTSFNFLDLVNKDHKKKVGTFYYRQLIKKDETSSLQFSFYTKDGTFKWLEQNVKLLMEGDEITGFQLIARDITERKKLEEFLRENLIRMSGIIEGTPNLFFYTQDSKGNNTYVSPTIEKITGYTIDRWLAAKDWFITDSKINNIAKERTHSNLRGELTKEAILLEIKHADGHMISLEIYESPIFRKGKVIGLQGVAHDITERKKADQALIESERKFKEMAELLPQIIFETDENGVLTYANEVAFSLFGYSKEEFSRKLSALQMIDPKERAIAAENILRVMKGEETTSHEYTALRKDGTNFPVLIFSNPIIKNGKVLGMRGTIIDITERKNAEEQILLLSHAVEKSPVSIMITDEQGNIEYVNQKFTEITGYTFEEVNGENPRLLKSGEKSDEGYKILWETIKSGKEWRGEFHNRKKNGELYWELASIVKVKNGKTFYLAVKEDITERKLIEEELIKAKEKAEESNKLKDSFIANISHEIRTPLNGILGMTSIIKEIYSPNINSDEVEYFTAINTSSERIIRTIDLILNYSQLETGTYTFIPNQIELSTLCKSLVSKFGVAAKSKSLSLSFDNKLGQVFIAASEYSITQVISNLIENAITYTNSGFVKVWLYQNQQNELLLDVMDSGIGISSEYLEHLFEPYRQEQMGYGRPYEGLGLGLALVKKILDLHNASISVKSIKEKGTTFTINFGNSAQNINEKTSNQNNAGEDGTATTKIDRVVLIVEDDEINQTTIKRFINRKYNSLVTDSYNGLMEILKNKKVDLILMDISLKDSKDGLEITKELKALKEYKHIPIIAATAYASERDRKVVMAAGCDDYLAKPFSMNQLLGKIDKFMQ